MCDEPESEHVRAASASNESLSTWMNMQDPVETENTVVWPLGRTFVEGFFFLSPNIKIRSLLF